MAKRKPTVQSNKRLINLRLGIKIKDVFWPFDVISISDVLERLGFEDIRSTPDQRVITAVKKQYDFYLDQPKMAFGFNADTPEMLIAAQKEFFATFKKDLNLDMEEHIRFYEIEHRMKYNTKNDVYEAVESLYSDSRDIDKINQLIGLPVKPNGINVIKRDGTPESDDWYSVEIIPLISSVPNAYICRMLLRGKSLQNVYNSLRKTTSVFEKLISHMESR